MSKENIEPANINYSETKSSAQSIQKEVKEGIQAMRMLDQPNRMSKLMNIKKEVKEELFDSECSASSKLTSFGKLSLLDSGSSTLGECNNIEGETQRAVRRSRESNLSKLTSISKISEKRGRGRPRKSVVTKQEGTKSTVERKVGEKKEVKGGNKSVKIKKESEDTVRLPKTTDASKIKSCKKLLPVELKTKSVNKKKELKQTASSSKSVTFKDSSAKISSSMCKNPTLPKGGRKRMELITLTSKTGKKVKEETVNEPPKEYRKTVRLNIPLSEPQEDNFPEYNYNTLLMEAQKKQANESPGSAYSFNLSTPMDEEDLIEKRIMESAYIDKGAGYDETDPFIDNSIPHDEQIPDDMVTEYGGFYVNTGKLTFRKTRTYNSDTSSDNNDSDIIKRLPKPKPRTPLKNLKFLAKKLRSSEVKKEKLQLKRLMKKREVKKKITNLKLKQVRQKLNDL